MYDKGVKKRGQVLLIIAGIVTAALLLYLLAPKEDLSTTSSMFKVIKSEIEGKYSNLRVSDEDEWLAQMNSGITDTVEGYDFKVNSQSAPTINIGFGDMGPNLKDTTQNIDDAQPILDAIMSRAGFAKSPGKDNIFYDKPPTTCVLVNDGNDLITLSCSTKDILKAQAESAKPLVDAYLAGKPGVPAADIAIGPTIFKDDRHAAQVITASKTPGFKIAEAVINKKVVVFYQKDGGAWVLASEADDEYGFRCGDFTANPDVRKAFYDQICLSETGQVRLDTANRALQ